MSQLVPSDRPNRYPTRYEDDFEVHPTNFDERDGGGMSTGKKVWIGVGILAALVVAANMKDLVRYIKIAKM